MVAKIRSGRLMRRRNLKPIGEEYTDEKLRALYTACVEDDRALARLGLGDYAERLRRIDAGQEA